MSRKYYVISMDSAWSPYRPCVGCPNNASDDDGHICHGGTECPLLTAKEAVEVCGCDKGIEHGYHNGKEVKLYATERGGK
jgi:hypothetical protein